MGNDLVAQCETFDNRGGIGVVDIAGHWGMTLASQNHEHAIADRKRHFVNLPSVGQQDAGARDINAERWSSSPELRMDSRSAWVAIRGLHRDEIALNLGDSALYHKRRRLSFNLGLEVRLRPKTCGAAMREQEDSCC